MGTKKKTTTKKSMKKAVAKTTARKPSVKKAIQTARDKMLLTALESYLIPEQTTIDLALKSLGGRPSACNKELCVKFISLMAEGRTATDACTLLGISEVTLYNWIKEYNEDEEGNLVINNNFKPEFFKAYKIGIQLQRLWWNEIGRKNLLNPQFNNSLWMMHMTNLFGWTRRLDGKIETVNKNISETHTTIKHEINITRDEAIAEIAQILYESGAIESETEEVIDTEIN